VAKVCLAYLLHNTRPQDWPKEKSDVEMYTDSYKRSGSSLYQDGLDYQLEFGSKYHCDTIFEYTNVYWMDHIEQHKNSRIDPEFTALL
jgi:hypothetical protein